MQSGTVCSHRGGGSAQWRCSQGPATLRQGHPLCITPPAGFPSLCGPLPPTLTWNVHTAETVLPQSQGPACTPALGLRLEPTASPFL